MPRPSEFPKFRTSNKRGPAGQVWTSYWYDMRGTGTSDIPLGTDRTAALSKWAELRGVEQQRAAELAVGAKPLKFRKRAKRAESLHRAPSAPLPGKRRNFDGVAWHHAPTWAKPMYIAVERRSREAGRQVLLTPAEFLAVVKRADGICELTGIPFSLERERGRRAPFGPSLDRIDCAKGYIAGNVRLVCLIANCALGDFGESVLKTFAEAFLARFAGAAPFSNAGATEDDLQNRL